MESGSALAACRDNEYWQPWLWDSPKLKEIRAAKLREMDFWVGD